MNTKLITATLALAALLPCTASGDDGHNHDAAPAAASGPALPRFAAVSDLFELVGVVDGKRLTLFLDRFADNTPVPGARIEVEIGGVKVAVKEHEPGEFEGSLAEALKPGVTAVTATILAGSDSDILAGDLDIHAEVHEAVAAQPVWRRYGPWALAGAAVLAALGWFARRSAASRAGRIGGAA